jgi:hypothetical protein
LDKSVIHEYVRKRKFIHIGTIKSVKRRLRLRFSSLAMYNTAGYATAKQTAVQASARPIDLAKIERYIGWKNALKYVNVNPPPPSSE